MAVTGKVDRDQRRRAQSHGNRVPGVRVLRTAVQQHQLGLAVTPDQRAQPPSRLDLDVLAAHRRRSVVRQAVLVRVLVEQAELVVLHPLDVFMCQPTSPSSPLLALEAIETAPPARVEAVQSRVTMIN